MATLTLALTPLLASRLYGAGTHACPTVAVPDTATSLYVEIDVSTHDDPACRWALILDVSLDGGASWGMWHSVARDGGVKRDAAGVPNPRSTIRRSLPAGTRRQLRGRLHLTRALTTSVTVEIT